MPQVSLPFCGETATTDDPNEGTGDGCDDSNGNTDRLIGHMFGHKKLVHYFNLRNLSTCAKQCIISWYPPGVLDALGPSLGDPRQTETLLGGTKSIVSYPMRGGGLIIEIVTIPGEIHLMLRSDNRRPKTPPPRDWTQHRQGSGGLLTEIQRCLGLNFKNVNKYRR